VTRVWKSRDGVCAVVVIVVFLFRNGKFVCREI